MNVEFVSLAPTALQVFEVGEENPKKVKRIVYGQATLDTNGIATLYFTDNGLANGFVHYLYLLMAHIYHPCA